MSRLFDPMKKDGTFPFAYTPAAATDVRATFARIRAEREKLAKAFPISMIRRTPR